MEPLQRPRHPEFKFSDAVFQMVFQRKIKPVFSDIYQIDSKSIQITPAHQFNTETRLERGFQTRFDGIGLLTVRL